MPGVFDIPSPHAACETAFHAAVRSGFSSTDAERIARAMEGTADFWEACVVSYLKKTLLDMVEIAREGKVAAAVRMANDVTDFASGGMRRAAVTLVAASVAMCWRVQNSADSADDMRCAWRAARSALALYRRPQTAQTWGITGLTVPDEGRALREQFGMFVSAAPGPEPPDPVTAPTWVPPTAAERTGPWSAPAGGVPVERHARDQFAGAGGASFAAPAAAGRVAPEATTVSEAASPPASTAPGAAPPHGLANVARTERSRAKNEASPPAAELPKQPPVHAAFSASSATRRPPMTMFPSKSSAGGASVKSAAEDARVPERAELPLFATPARALYDLLCEQTPYADTPAPAACGSAEAPAAPEGIGILPNDPAPDVLSPGEPSHDVPAVNAPAARSTSGNRWDFDTAFSQHPIGRCDAGCLQRYVDQYIQYTVKSKDKPTKDEPTKDEPTKDEPTKDEPTLADYDRFLGLPDDASGLGHIVPDLEKISDDDANSCIPACAVGRFVDVVGAAYPNCLMLPPFVDGTKHDDAVKSVKQRIRDRRVPKWGFAIGTVCSPEGWWSVFCVQPNTTPKSRSKEPAHVFEYCPMAPTDRKTAPTFAALKPALDALCDAISIKKPGNSDLNPVTLPGRRKTHKLFKVTRKTSSAAVCLAVLGFASACCLGPPSKHPSVIEDFIAKEYPTRVRRALLCLIVAGRACAEGGLDPHGSDFERLVPASALLPHEFELELQMCGGHTSTLDLVLGLPRINPSWGEAGPRGLVGGEGRCYFNCVGQCCAATFNSDDLANKRVPILDLVRYILRLSDDRPDDCCLRLAGTDDQPLDDARDCVELFEQWANAQGALAAQSDVSLIRDENGSIQNFKVLSVPCEARRLLELLENVCIVKTNRYVAIHIQRTTTTEFRKLIKSEADIDVPSEFCLGDSHYRVTAVIVHSGSVVEGARQNSNHYVCYVLYDQWWYVSDDFVRPLGTDRPKELSKAYMVFARRAGLAQAAPPHSERCHAAPSAMTLSDDVTACLKEDLRALCRAPKKGDFSEDMDSRRADAELRCRACALIDEDAVTGKVREELLVDAPEDCEHVAMRIVHHGLDENKLGDESTVGRYSQTMMDRLFDIIAAGFPSTVAVLPSEVCKPGKKREGLQENLQSTVNERLRFLDHPKGDSPVPRHILAPVIGDGHWSLLQLIPISDDDADDQGKLRARVYSSMADETGLEAVRVFLCTLLEGRVDGDIEFHAKAPFEQGDSRSCGVFVCLMALAAAVQVHRDEAPNHDTLLGLFETQRDLGKWVAAQRYMQVHDMVIGYLESYVKDDVTSQLIDRDDDDDGATTAPPASQRSSVGPADSSATGSGCRKRAKTSSGAADAEVLRSPPQQPRAESERSPSPTALGGSAAAPTAPAVGHTAGPPPATSEQGGRVERDGVSSTPRHTTRLSELGVGYLPDTQDSGGADRIWHQNSVANSKRSS